MKWVLIAVFVMTNDGAGLKAGGTGFKGFAFQEFDSKKTCEDAMGVTTRMVQSLDAVNAAMYRLGCVPK